MCLMQMWSYIYLHCELQKCIIRKQHHLQCTNIRVHLKAGRFQSFLQTRLDGNQSWNATPHNCHPFHTLLLHTFSEYCTHTQSYTCICNGAEWSKDKTQAAESIKWRPQQAYGGNQFLLVQPQTVFSTHTKSSRSRIDKRTARATGNTRYRYSKIAPLDHKMADNCVSLARTNTLSSTITKLIKTSKASNKSYSYHLLNRINKMYTHDLFYLHKEWEAWLVPVYIQIRTTKSQLTQCTKYKRD